jgi:hypothetical protein
MNFSALLTSLIGGRAGGRPRREPPPANTVISAVIDYARGLMADGPWKPR